MFSKINSFSDDGKDVPEEVPQDYRSFLTDLETTYGVVSEYLIDYKGFVSCVYFQDSHMKDVFNFFPDRLCVDVSFKRFDTDIFMYLFLSEDTNGKNVIVSLAFLVECDCESIIWLFSTFKKHNPNWRRIKLLILDPEVAHRQTIRNMFSNTYFILCYYHAHRFFRKGLEEIQKRNFLSMDKMNFALDIFKNMYFSHSQQEYDIYCQQLFMLNSAIVSYFHDVWMPLYQEWHLDYGHENLFCSLNSCLHSFESNLKHIFNGECCAMELIKKMFFVISLLRNEKQNMILPDTKFYSQFSTEYQICKLLTPYAAKFVLDQFELSFEIRIENNILAESYVFDNFGSHVNATDSSCTCQFFLYTFLPCRHIFAVRRSISAATFVDALIEQKWTLKFYKQTIISIQSNGQATKPTETAKSRSAVLANLSEMINVSLVNASKSEYDTHVDTLKQILDLWSHNKTTYLKLTNIKNEDDIEMPSSFSMPLNLKEEEEKEDESNFFAPDFILQSLEADSPISTKKLNVSYDNEELANYIDDEMNISQVKWNFKSQMLNGEDINFAYLSRVICGSKSKCLEWLQEMGFILSTMLCHTCGRDMSLKPVPRLSDGAVWMCTNVENKKSCSRRCSVRRGSWFELTNMSFEQILTFCYMWVNGFCQNQIISETGISTATFISWNKLNRRVCEEVLSDDETFSKGDSSSIAEVLNIWMEGCENEDTFLKFLRDANCMHRKDSEKHSMP